MDSSRSLDASSWRGDPGEFVFRLAQFGHNVLTNRQ